jgi:homoserine O-succinyltransferase
VKKSWQPMGNPTKRWKRLRQPFCADREEIVIGLVNNMSGAAFHMAERQFCDLLTDAGKDLKFRVRTFSPVGPPPGSQRASSFQSCGTPDELWASNLDALIVTGAEPKAARLPDEPIWPFFTRLADWAEDNTISTVWSCLAAHGAAYHLDGVERRHRGTKLFGLFTCENLQSHPISAGLPSRWAAPHSRFNDLPEDTLVARGYRILSRSAKAGADGFMKQSRSLHLFLQGHPEYDGNGLSREYCRDVKRYLCRDSDRYPEIPENYFSDHVVAELDAFRRRALEDRSPDMYRQFPHSAIVLNSEAPWRPVALQLYRNWLTHLAARKAIDTGLHSHTTSTTAIQAAAEGGQTNTSLKTAP